ncbi:MAG: vitamin K epoxide reductase family protein [Acaryochloridaceae cyanobacterium SU_2_1]|nr:vitamin K epoxide reductase family protein [Acaryochloridaceae cyanobacterium SU_2_1]
MGRRRQKTSGLHRWSRPLIGAIAVLGATNTGYLTFTRLAGGETACPTGGCNLVLSSPYATIFGQPLALFGLLAYLAMALFALVPLALSSSEDKDLRSKIDNSTWLLLFLGSTAMMFFSWYLMYIMVTKFMVPYGGKAICLFCIASATFATLMFVFTLLGKAWEDVGQLIFSGLIVVVITLIGTLGIYSTIDQPLATKTSQATTEYNIKAPNGQVFFTINDPSGPAEIELAKHLKATGAKMYGAVWCSHCAAQKKRFGIQAISEMPYVECFPEISNLQTQTPIELCSQELDKAKQTGDGGGYPTWKIAGKYYGGEQPLTDLAKASNYQGPTNFKSSQ